MKNKWIDLELQDFLEINPKEKLPKGTEALKVPMDALSPYQKYIQGGEEAFYSGGAKFRNGDTLLARITPCLENGKTAFVDVLQEGEIGFGSTEFIVLREREGVSDKEFIFYLATSPLLRRVAIAAMTGSSGRQRVQTDVLSNYTFTLPPLQTQIGISEILKSLDDKIDLLRRQNATLEAMAQTLFRSWFVDFDPVIDKALAAGRELPKALAGRVAKRRKVLAHDHYPRLPEEVMALFPDRFVFSEELGKWVPEGWEVKPLTQIAKYQNGLALQKFRPDSEDDNFLPVLKISHLRQGYTDGKERAKTDIKESCRVKDGDIIFSWSGSLLVRVWTGGVAALNQHLFKVTSKKFPKWLYYLYTQHHLNNFIHIAESKAVTMGHIKRSHLEEALCVLPSNEIITRCGMVINPMIEQVISNGLASNNLTNLRDTVLPPLICGKLSVENFTTAEGTVTD